MLFYEMDSSYKDMNITNTNQEMDTKVVMLCEFSRVDFKLSNGLLLNV